MTRYAAFLRAVNVGGTGKLPMATLREICGACGFAGVRTYIASGNVVFDWDGAATDAQARLEAALAEYAGKPVGVMIRDAAQLAAVTAEMPFKDAPGNQAVVIFLDETPPVDAVAGARGLNGEEIALGDREVFVHYVRGQGGSKLHIPAAASGTARNMNTVRKVLAMLQSKRA